ncbi:MAG: hypothetical protein ACI32C_01325 [Candidatus Enteromonas sp.]
MAMLNILKKTTAILNLLPIAFTAIVEPTPLKTNASFLSEDSICVNDSFEAGCAAYGFHYSTDWTPVKTTGFACWFEPVYDTEELQYETDIHAILLRSKSAWNVYCYAYRVTQTAYQPGRDPGFFGIGSHGDNWYSRGVRVTAQLSQDYHYTMTNHSPENAPKSGSYNVGVSFGTSGFQVEDAQQVVLDELEIVDHTKEATGLFDMDYVVSGFGNYSANTLHFYGMILFATPTSPYREPYLTAHFETRFFGKEYHHLTTKTITHGF